MSVYMVSRRALVTDGVKSALQKFFEENYEDDVRKLEDNSVNSISIDYQKLKSFSKELSNELAHNPNSWFANATAALEDYSDDLDISHPQVLIENYDTYTPTIRDLRDTHLGKVISVDGIVSKTTSVLPKAETAAFECRRCGAITNVRQPMNTDLKYPNVCSGDECQNRSERDFNLNVGLSKKINFRKIEIQEPPEETSGGNTPESETFTIKGDVANNISAGDNVKSVGIYKATEQGETSVFKTYIHGNNIIPEEQEFEEIEITDEEKEVIKDLASDDDIYEIIRDSIGPSLYGLEKEKTAIMYQLFSGVRKTEMSGTNIRGDIHVLFVGDPGTGKSQLLRYASKLTPRGIMTNGKGASEAGITAAAVRDSEFGGTEKWTLQAGALVLADKGLACVDELDKMNPSDRSAMHEGLEQQTISVSKAGINATLKSRCTLLGAANPKEGRWDEYAPIAKQIDLEPALISRFDLIFAPKDERSDDRDGNLADYVLMTNHRGEQLEAGQKPDKASENVVPEIKPELFRKYVAYAKKNYNPVMTKEAREHIKSFFVQIRSDGEEEGAIPVTARKLEGLVRLSEAAARIQLKDKVEKEHAEKAIDIVMDSLRDVGYDEEAGRYDVDMTETKQSTSQRNRKKLIIQLVSDFEDEGDEGAPKDLIIDVLTEEYDFSEDEIESELIELSRKGRDIYEPRTNEYRTM